MERFQFDDTLSFATAAWLAISAIRATLDEVTHNLPEDLLDLLTETLHSAPDEVLETVIAVREIFNDQETTEE